MTTSAQQRSHFGNYIRTRREELGLSLRQLEQRTGIPNSRLSRWERGNELPDRPQRLVSLATGLGLNPADLYAYAGIPPLAELPNLDTYLRQRYGRHVPDDVLNEIGEQAKRTARRHGITLG